MVYKYEIILYWSKADDVFVAEVPALPGCIAHGNTQEATLKNVNKAIEFWDSIPKSRGEWLILV